MQFTKRVGRRKASSPAIQAMPGRRGERNVKDPGTGRSEFLGWAVGRQGYEKGRGCSGHPESSVACQFVSSFPLPLSCMYHYPGAGLVSRTFQHPTVPCLNSYSPSHCLSYQILRDMFATDWSCIISIKPPSRPLGSAAIMPRKEEICNETSLNKPKNIHYNTVSMYIYLHT